ncbi:hypothetical protein [Vibrio crassostreae]|uniref:hypothetical protein n=1 Tax=Vibrio crassostreae TaxID=246167 RepID=UPI001049C99F|nr:hypothetical protein [Vibrio crassostreae]TCO01803.1 hypothetical protein EDB51_10683 [Vibrio crassostreae]CAK2036291.1 conserved hypothetical protein [Vibrio crassostreae]CAK2046884.1 conserved hypothetical protein [Vibrio crassostreae]CAK2073277.1 conserved hypothetical protein [Vibrio crassostreae]CAK2078841.1 conserved hypothetical protein [Vibrio crassostreae]
MNQFSVIGFIVKSSLLKKDIQPADDISYPGCSFLVQTDNFLVSCCSLDKYINNAFDKLLSANGKVKLDGFLFVDTYSDNSSLAVVTSITELN